MVGDSLRERGRGAVLNSAIAILLTAVGAIADSACVPSAALACVRRRGHRSPPYACIGAMPTREHPHLERDARVRTRQLLERSTNAKPPR